MTLATTQISRLVTHSRVFPINSPGSPQLLPQLSPSSLQAVPLPADERELDQTRINAMDTLVSILKRNTRVRYEIDVVELVEACVSPPSVESDGLMAIGGV